ncbi:helix-turn-helix domain-containing protein [Streptomyces microflavus]|uniref:helix-turn-helix domain-containing protein n=1 Tax=Streptomyces microflavus TaxID=1919 RepID=UPI0038086374
MSSGLAENVRRFRRAAGLSQEGLAEEADLSLSTVRKVEQGGRVSMDTLASLARALGVSTSDLFASEAPEPTIGAADEANRRGMAEMRRALMPPVGLSAPLSGLGGAGEGAPGRSPWRTGRPHALPSRPLHVRGPRPPWPVAGV